MERSCKWGEVSANITNLPGGVPLVISTGTDLGDHAQRGRGSAVCPARWR